MKQEKVELSPERLPGDEFRDRLLLELQSTYEANHQLTEKLQVAEGEVGQLRAQLGLAQSQIQLLFEQAKRNVSWRQHRITLFLLKWCNPRRYARFAYRTLRSALKKYQPAPHERPARVERLVPEPVGPLPQKYRVSVVIPTYNGGEDLPYLLRSLSQQEGCVVEIVAVDSGSTDNSVALLQYFGATVVEINKADFSHSHARNLGVSHAKYPLTLCTVQDALPTDQRWLYRACALLERTECDALSLAQVPRTDADLFAAVNIAEFNDYLEISNGRTNVTTKLSSDPVIRRREAQLDNVATLYRTQSLVQRPFEGAYGEDINIGIRLVTDGRKIGKTGECRVVHSHARRPGYYLKRYFVDTKHLFLAKILLPNLQERDFVEFKRGFVFALAFVAMIRRDYLRGTKPQPATLLTNYLGGCGLIDPVFVRTEEIRSLLESNLPHARLFDEFCDPSVLFDQAKKNGGELFQHTLYAYQRQVATFVKTNPVLDQSGQELLYLTLQQTLFCTAGSLIANFDFLGLVPLGDRPFVDSLRENV